MARGRMSAIVVAQYVVIVHDRKPPQEAEWQRWLEMYQRALPELRGVLVYSLGGGPDAAQRGALIELTKGWGQGPPTAIVTGSVVMRGLVTALHWFLPAHLRAAMFAPGDLEHALDHLRVPSATRPALRAQLQQSLQSFSSEDDAQPPL